jgi:hypothetical protein
MSTCTKGSGTAASADKTATGGTTQSSPAATTAAGAATASTPADKAKAADQSATTGDQWVATPGSNKSNPQQQKMKACATDAKAKGLKGVDRRNYMSTCLKADSAAPAATPTPAKKPTK